MLNPKQFPEYGQFYEQAQKKGPSEFLQKQPDESVIDEVHTVSDWWVEHHVRHDPKMRRPLLVYQGHGDSWQAHNDLVARGHESQLAEYSAEAQRRGLKLPERDLPEEVRGGGVPEKWRYRNAANEPYDPDAEDNWSL